MQENSEKTRPSTSSGGQFIDTLIEQWVKRTGTNIVFHQAADEQVAESLNSEKSKQPLQNNILFLQRKLKESQQAEISLSTSLETEMRNKEEIQTKLNATWESIETITEYFNYVSESLASFQQHRVNLSNLYDNVILKQQGSIQKLQSNNAKLKDLEKRNVQLENELLLQEKRLQEATTEQNKLRKQLEDTVYEQQTQKNELTQAHAEEKLALVKEQQQLLLEHENLQSQLQIAENEKCNIAKSAAQLQNKLLLHEEKIQAALTEQNKLQKQFENANIEYHMEKSNLISAHAEEKNKLIEEQQRLQTECDSLQSRLNILERDKSNTAETVTQKTALILKLRNENLMYKNQIEALVAENNEARNKYDALEEKQNIRENELRTKMERIQNLETTLNAAKQKETRLVNDVNRMEKKLTNQMDYSKNLESKLSSTKKELHIAETQNTEMQKTLNSSKAASELTNSELQKKLKTLQREKEEAVKHETASAKNAEVLYENIRTKHVEEMSALTNSYETRLLELKKTVDGLKDTNNDIVQENSTLKTSLAEMREENVSLKSDYQFAMERNRDLQEKLKNEEATQASQRKSSGSQEFEKSLWKDKRQLKGEYTVSTSAELESQIWELGDNEHGRSLSQQLSRTYSMKRESPKAQEEEVTSAGKKFFKSRPPGLRTYSKRR